MCLSHTHGNRFRGYQLVAEPDNQVWAAAAPKSAPVLMKILGINSRGGHQVLLMVAVMFVAEHLLDAAGATLANGDANGDGPMATSADTAADKSTVLVLVQQTDETDLRPDDIGDRFRQFVDVYDIELRNVTVDFDIGMGKLLSVCFWPRSSINIGRGGIWRHDY